MKYDFIGLLSTKPFEERILQNLSTACLLVANVVAGQASAQSIVNGSFESFTGTLGSDNGAQLLPGATTLTGWTIVGGEIGVLKAPNPYELTGSNGLTFLDLAGYTNSGFPKGISQTITGLTSGQAYAVTLDVGLRNGTCGGGNCAGPVQVSVNVNGASQTFSHASSVAGNVWATYSLNFIATTTSASLTINGAGLPANGIYIGLDNVAISAVPEPTAAASLSIGLLATLLVVNQKMRNRRLRNIDA